jgi:hypothetical protein
MGGRVGIWRNFGFLVEKVYIKEIGKEKKRNKRGQRKKEENKEKEKEEKR